MKGVLFFLCLILSSCGTKLDDLMLFADGQPGISSSKVQSKAIEVWKADAAFVPAKHNSQNMVFDSTDFIDIWIEDNWHYKGWRRSNKPGIGHGEKLICRLSVSGMNKVKNSTLWYGDNIGKFSPNNLGDRFIYEDAFNNGDTVIVYIYPKPESRDYIGKLKFLKTKKREEPAPPYHPKFHPFPNNL